MKFNGLSLIELLVVLGIISILVLISGITLMKYIPDYRLNSNTREIISVMNQARMEAVKRNSRAVIIFDINNENYTAFMDTNPINWALDANEHIIYSKQLENNIELHNCTIPSNTYGYNGRGVAVDPTSMNGKIFLKNIQNDYKGLEFFGTGTVSVID